MEFSVPKMSFEHRGHGAKARCRMCRRRIKGAQRASHLRPLYTASSPLAWRLCARSGETIGLRHHGWIAMLDLLLLALGLGLFGLLAAYAIGCERV